MDRRRKAILAAVVAICVLAGVAYVAIAALGPSPTTTGASPRPVAVPAGADLLVRAVDPDSPRLNGRLFEAGAGEVSPEPGELSCQRVYFAAGRGICMAVAPSGVDYTATIFGREMQPLRTIGLTGVPSRARVSDDGSYGAMTVFVTGDSYLGSSAAFSTRTTIVEMASGEQLAQLEQFEVTKGGKPFDAVDFNFWGVTFDPVDPNRFYATLATGGHHYLVAGNLRERQMRVLRDGVECPSLSPDGTQIAYKSRIGNSNRWHLRVLDLATLDDHGLAEQRSIDDQPEWLDERTLVYSNGTDVFTVPADGSGTSQRILRDATSPVSLGQRL